MSNIHSLLSIQVGQVKPIDINGETVMSAIIKSPVDGPVKVSRLGLEGDQQADPTVHGGLAKAVYAYPSEHYGYWRDEQAKQENPRDLPFGTLGENLTLSGLLEDDVFVGDELHFDDCVLRVTQPRQPCFKLNSILGDRLGGKKMAQTGYCGFYLSVVKDGFLNPSEGFELVPGARDTSIASLFKVTMFKSRND